MATHTPIRSSRLVAAAVAVQALLAAASALAQQTDGTREHNVFVLSNTAQAMPVPPVPFPAPSFGIVSVIGSDAGTLVEGKPYTADAVTTATQQLADGNRITHRNEARVYRDSAGRTRREQSLMPGGVASQPGSAAMITINDPVAGTAFMLDTNAETVRRLPSFDITAGTASGGMFLRREFRPPNPPNPPNSGEPGEPGEFQVVIQRNAEIHADSERTVEYRTDESGERTDVIVQAFTQAIPAPANAPLRAARLTAAPAIGSQFETRTEDLGEQVLQGVRAQGTRHTHTIPAGAIGNERPIDVVSEQWYSPELEVDVLRRNSDPRTGETVYELVNIDRSEPPADLFAIPSGYETVGRRDWVEVDVERAQ